MCFDPATWAAMAIVGALTTATQGVSSYMQVKAQNQAATQQYEFQQKQANLVAQAAQEQFTESIARQRLETKRAAESAQGQAQQQMLENLRRQATAQASASTQGITGMPLQLLFNDYQVAVGGIATNLDTTYKQLNENLFFNTDSARREAQSRVNAAQPAPPILSNWSILPSALQGLSAAGSIAAGGLTGFGGATRAAVTKTATTRAAAQPLGPVWSINPAM